MVEVLTAERLRLVQKSADQILVDQGAGGPR